MASRTRSGRPPSGRTTRSATSGCAGCAGCPSERRLRADDGTMVLVCHASPGLADGRASTRRSTPTSSSSGSSRTDARVIALRPHPPPRGPRPRLEDHRQRRVGGLRLRRRPDRVLGAHRPRRRRRHRRDPADRVRRARGRERDLRARPARRRLPRRDGPHREARPMTGPAARVVVTGMGAVTALGNDVASHLGRAWSRAAPASRTIEAFDPSRLTSRIAAEVRDFDAERRARPQGHAADGPLHPVRARRRAPGARPGRPAGAARGRRSPSGPACILGHRARRRRDALRRDLHERPARPGPDQPVPHPDGHPERRRRARSRSTSG